MILSKELKPRFYSLLFVFCLGFILASAKGTKAINPYTTSLTGTVTAVTDGDTFKLLTTDSIIHRVRIANIDCPEKKQPYAQRAKQFTSQAIYGKTVCLNVQSKDRYGRLIATVNYQDTLVLNEELLKHGYAWHFLKYSKDSILQALENRARIQRKGLWQDPHPVPPWEWRSSKKK